MPVRQVLRPFMKEYRHRIIPGVLNTCQVSECNGQKKEKASLYRKAGMNVIWGGRNGKNMVPESMKRTATEIGAFLCGMAPVERFQRS